MASFYDILDEVSMNPAAIKATENLKKAEDAQKKLMDLVSKNPNGIPTADAAMIAGQIDKNIGSATANLANSLKQMQQRKEEEIERLKKEQEGQQAASPTVTSQGVGSTTSIRKNTKPNPQPPKRAPKPQKMGTALDKLKEEIAFKKSK